MVRGHPGEQIRLLLIHRSPLNKHRRIELNLPCWRNGSVFVLHAKGSGSIPLRGTKGVIEQVVSSAVCKIVLILVGSIPTGPTK